MSTVIVNPPRKTNSWPRAVWSAQSSLARPGAGEEPGGGCLPSGHQAWVDLRHYAGKSGNDQSLFQSSTLDSSCHTTCWRACCKPALLDKHHATIQGFREQQGRGLQWQAADEATECHPSPSLRQSTQQLPKSGRLKYIVKKMDIESANILLCNLLKYV